MLFHVDAYISLSTENKLMMKQIQAIMSITLVGFSLFTFGSCRFMKILCTNSFCGRLHFKMYAPHLSDEMQ